MHRVDEHASLTYGSAANSSHRKEAKSKRQCLRHYDTLFLFPIGSAWFTKGNDVHVITQTAQPQDFRDTITNNDHRSWLPTLRLETVKQYPLFWLKKTC
eukprot:1160745-Pelagomonas_calceolata.AAC.21